MAFRLQLAWSARALARRYSRRVPTSCFLNAAASPPAIPGLSIHGFPCLHPACTLLPASQRPVFSCVWKRGVVHVRPAEMSYCPRFRDGTERGLCLIHWALGRSGLNVMGKKHCEMFPAGCIGTQILIRTKVYAVVGPNSGLLAVSLNIVYYSRALVNHVVVLGKWRRKCFLFPAVGGMVPKSLRL